MKRAGFTPVIALLIIASVLALGILGYFHFRKYFLNPNAMYWMDVKAAMVKCEVADYQDPPSPGGFRYIDLKNGGMKVIVDTPAPTEWANALDRVSSSCGQISVAHVIWN